MQIQYMHKRDGFWYYILWVPRAVAYRHDGPFVRRSTGIRIADDPRGITARTRVLDMDADQTLRWNDLAAGRDPGERQTYQRCLRIADKLGNDSVELGATILSADLADSTGLVNTATTQFAAEKYKTYLSCCARIIKKRGWTDNRLRRRPHRPCTSATTRTQRQEPSPR